MINRFTKWGDFILVSLEFIANKANVSKSLVSRVLNNREVRVSEDKRQEIIDIAKKYNYVPNRMAASLRTKKTNTIAVIVPNIQFDFFGKLVYEIEHTARHHGYSVLVCNTTESLEVERNYLEMYRAGIIDGLIIDPTGYEKNNDMFIDMNKNKFPYVFVDRYVDLKDISYVVSDCINGMNYLTDKLIEDGHEDITFISRYKSINTSEQIDRYKGYCQSMNQNNLTTQVSNIYEDDLSINSDLYNLIKNKKNKAVILSTSWDMHIFLEMCYQLGYKIPQDIEVATFDTFKLQYSTKEDMQLADVFNRQIHIMEQSIEELAVKSVELLIEKIQNDNQSNQQIYIKPNLIQ